MKDENEVDSKAHFLKSSLLVILIFCIVIIVARYVTDEAFRTEIDTNIFGKQVAESSLNTIEINSDTTPTVFAYGKYISVLSKTKLSVYYNCILNLWSIFMNSGINIGNKIKDLRTQKGLTQEELANLLGVTINDIIVTEQNTQLQASA